MTAVAELLPRWTKKVLTEMTGRDPLGLSRVSDIIIDFLLTGITATTGRARYYSFYCWTLWHITREEEPQTPQQFVDAFRRREAVLALATLAHNPKTSPIGVLATRPQLQQGEVSGIVDCDFQVLPSNQLGGYGQDYQGSLRKLGLVDTEDGIDRVSAGAAEEISEAFHETIEHTSYIQKRLFKGLRFDFADLDALKDSLTLDALPEPFAARERQKLVELFFGLNTTARLRTNFRQQTLTLVLHIVSEYEKHDSPASVESVDWYLVCPPHYYGTLWLKQSKPVPYIAPSGFDSCQSLWKQFCLQQFLAQTLEEFFCSVLETIGNAHVQPTVAELVTMMQSGLCESLEQEINGSCKSPRELLLSYGISKQPDQQVSEDLQRLLSLDDPRSEAKIFEIERETPELAAITRALLLLATLYGKWRGIHNELGYSYVAHRAAGELWAGNFLPNLDSWLLTGMTWEKAILALVEALINQHDRVMYEKARLDSCWIRRFDGRLGKDQDYWPLWRSSRHSSVINILCDLALLSISDSGDLLLTSNGRQLLQTLLGSGQ